MQSCIKFATKMVSGTVLVLATVFILAITAGALGTTVAADQRPIMAIDDGLIDEFAPPEENKPPVRVAFTCNKTAILVLADELVSSMARSSFEAYRAVGACFVPGFNVMVDAWTVVGFKRVDAEGDAFYVLDLSGGHYTIAWVGYNLPSTYIPVGLNA